MVVGPTILHSYSPEKRTVAKGMIIFRQAGDPYMPCKEEVDKIYDKVRRLLLTVETWMEYSLDDEVTQEVVQALYISVNKTMAIVTKDIEELITTHGVTNRGDVFEIRDVGVQLQEIADAIFDAYIK